MPFIPDAKNIFSNMLVDETRANDILLALDRGEYPTVLKYENHDIILQKIADRMKKGDYTYIVQGNPVVQQNYEKQVVEREQIKQSKKVEEGYEDNEYGQCNKRCIGYKTH